LIGNAQIAPETLMQLPFDPLAASAG